MIKILIFAPLPLEQGRGGELSAIELASGLKKYYHVSLVDTNKAFGQGSLSRNIISEKLKDVKRARIKFYTFSFLKRNFGVIYPWEFIKLLRIVKRNDITYFTLSGIGSNLIFIIISLLLPKANLIVGHRLPLYSEKKHSLYNIRLQISFILFKLFNKRFYHHTISFRRKKFLENYFIPEKIEHVIHCVELTQFIGDTNVSYKNEVLKFLYVGYLDYEDKGIDVLSAAIDKYLKDNPKKNVHFEFCGKGPLESEIKALEKSYPIHVKFHGYVNYDKVATHYKRNDVFLFTSRREAFGRVIIEAMAAKLLILCSKTIGSNEILKNKEFAFFLDKLTPEEIITKIEELYNLWKNEPNTFKTLQEQSKQYAFDRYDYSNELNGFRKFFYNILSRKI